MRLTVVSVATLVGGIATSALAGQTAPVRPRAQAPEIAVTVRSQATDAFGNTALHRAVESDDVAEVNRLIRARADVNALNRYHVAPLSTAVLHGNLPIVTALLGAGADPRVIKGEGEPVMLTAARTGNVDIIKALVAAGGDVNTREKFYGQTPLMWAAIEDHAEAIVELAASGADVNARANVLEGEPSWRYGKDSRNGINGEALQNFNTNFSKGGLNPLMYAARQGSSNAARALLEKGANPATTDPEGYSPLLLAIMNAHYDTAAVMIEKGADVAQVDRGGQTPLYALVDIRSLLWSYNRPTPRTQNEMTSLDLARLLIAKGAPVNAKLTGAARRPLGGGGAPIAGRGATPFLRAAVTSDLPMMKLLLEHGADPKVVTQNGDNALHAAAGVRWSDTTMSTAQAMGFGVEADSVEAITMLIGLGLDVNTADKAGMTAMHGAASRGANQIIRLLASRGAKLDVMSNADSREQTVDNEPSLEIPGQTPLDAALDSDPPRTSTVALLRELMGQDPSAPMRAPTKKR
ncbi:MAG: ankyrin repeat domain-containing protein [Vicinamibacterales bacterium]